MSHTARLAELGIELPHVAAPVAAYVPAVRTGDLVFTSGQLPTIAGEMIAHGLVGTAVEPEIAKEMARTCALNGLAAVNSLVGLDNVVRWETEPALAASTLNVRGTFLMRYYW